MKVIIVGRNPDNDIVIPDGKVSRIHLQIIQNDSGICSVVDLNSANGTYVNGKKITNEVQLLPNDELRIGNTILPWQSYIMSSPDSHSHANEPACGNISSKSNKVNKLWIFIIISFVILFIVGGVGIFIYKNNQESALQTDSVFNEQTEFEEELLEKRRLQDEANEELYRQGLRAERDKHKELALEKQMEAYKADAKAKTATEAAASARKAKAEADAKAKTAAEDAASARKAKAEADVKAKIAAEAADSAKNAKAKAEKERNNANESLKLTERFYEEYSVMKNSLAKAVCKKLKKDAANVNDPKVYLNKLFKDSDNKGKREILNTIDILKKKDKTAKTDEKLSEHVNDTDKSNS